MKVALLGCGLIGGSIGLSLKKHLPEVEIIVYDLDRHAAERAVERGAADRIATDPAGAVEGASLVFLATPVGVAPDLLGSVADKLQEGAIVTDVGSTKSRVVVKAGESLPSTVSFIGGHPMAGSEEAGIEAATADLFAGAWWILTPTEHSDPTAYEQLHGILTALGARVMALAPEEHDELMATISHVPQLTATALMNMAAERGKEHGGLLALAAGGFRDVTRVAASNPDIWVDICRENRDAIGEALHTFVERLISLRDLVKRGDETALREQLLAARTARRSLPGKAVDGDLWEVRFPVPDRPGVLAEVTTAVGNLGINIEDLQIAHATEGGRGTIHLAVIGEEGATRICTQLRERGYDARSASL